MRHLGLTYDEPYKYAYGQRVLNHNPERINIHDDGKMPFNALNVLCTQTLMLFFAIDSPVKAGRYMTIMGGMILAFYVFRWSSVLYGAVPALFSLILFIFDPNIIAHARLVTTDIYASLMMTMSLYYFWKFLKLGGLKNGVICAFVLGISQAAKYTCLSLYALCFVIGMGKYLYLCYEFRIQRDYKRIGVLTQKLLAYGGLFISVGILIINLSFGFVRTGTLLKDYKFDSHSFRVIQSIPLLKEFPVPLPYDYLRGLDMLELGNLKGYCYGNIYLLGHLKDKSKGETKGFGGYFLYTYLFKTPLASQIIILLALFHYWYRRRWDHFIRNEIFLILPVLCFIIYMNFFFYMQVGIRYILFYFPLLYVFAGSLFINWHKFKTSVKVTYVSLLIYLAISTLSYFPHYISYFNEFVWDRKMAYKLLADSNIDWGGQ